MRCDYDNIPSLPICNMTKIFEANLIEDTDWVNSTTTIPEWVGTFEYKVPEVGMNLLNFHIAIPISKIFNKIPNKPKRIIIYME